MEVGKHDRWKPFSLFRHTAQHVWGAWGLLACLLMVGSHCMIQMQSLYLLVLKTVSFVRKIPGYTTLELNNRDKINGQEKDEYVQY